jgi:hypothetical protein
MPPADRTQARETAIGPPARDVTIRGNDPGQSDGFCHSRAVRTSTPVLTRAAAAPIIAW